MKHIETIQKPCLKNSLAHGGCGLFVLKAPRRQVQPSAPQSHGAGRDDDDLAALSA